MTRFRFSVLVIVTFLGAAVGGFSANGTINAFADKRPVPGIIEATAFKVVDNGGKEIGLFDAQGLSIVKNDKNDSYSAKLDYMGLRVSHDSPSYWKYEKVESRLWSFGFEYKEYSKREIERLEKMPLYGLFDSSTSRNIFIGGNEGRSPGPAILLYDSNSNLRLQMGSADLVEKKSDSVIQRPPSSIVLFNDKGGVVWQAP